MSATLLLSRLQGVRQRGNGWRADCPNGHSNARGSLAITDSDSGSVILHCFACGDTRGVLRALGMELADLFPMRVKDASPEGRKAAADAFKRNAWGAALGVLHRESTVVLIAANDLHAGNALAFADMARVGMAAQRIAQAREVLL